MLDIKRHIQEMLPARDPKELTYTQIGYIAMGPVGKWAVNIAVLGCNLGVCAGYMIFISTNLQVIRYQEIFFADLIFSPLTLIITVGVQLHLSAN